MSGAGASKRGIGCAAIIAGAFVVLWVGVTAAGTAMCYGSFLNIIRVRQSYQPTPGFVEQAGIERSAGRRSGSSYKPEVSYRYTVSGTAYRGDRFSVWENWDDQSELEKRLRLFPVGAPATVWFLPSDPTRSYLDPHAENFPYLLFVFLVPFQLISAIIFWGIYTVARTTIFGLERSLARQYFLVDRPEKLVARLGESSPRFMGLVGFGMACFFAIFPIAFTAGFNCPPWCVPVVFVIAIGTGVVFSIRDRRKHPPVLDRLIIDRLTGRFRLRAVEGPTAEIAEVRVSPRTQLDSDGEQEELFDVVFRMHTGKNLTLFDGLSSNEDAEALASMIRERLHGPAGTRTGKSSIEGNAPHTLD